MPEITGIRHAEWFINAHRTSTAPTVHLVYPWPSKDKVTAEERAELEATLERRSAFG